MRGLKLCCSIAHSPLCVKNRQRRTNPREGIETTWKRNNPGGLVTYVREERILVRGLKLPDRNRHEVYIRLRDEVREERILVRGLKLPDSLTTVLHAYDTVREERILVRGLKRSRAWR